jgi:competence protein ComEC
MRHIAAVPAVGMLAGAAAGLLLPSLPAVQAFCLFICCGILSVWAWRAGDPRALGAAVALGFFVGGALLAADAWQRAWRPSLRVAFEEAAKRQRTKAEAAGRRLPEDDEAFAIVEGMLRVDAAQTESGVSLSIAVDRILGQEGQEGRDRPSLSRPAIGGIVVTVVGTLAAEHLDEWRQGRRLRLPVVLRRPSRYLDPGVPDHERALARRGTILVGTVKSGGLVEVLARGNWVDETMSAARAFARRAIAGSVGRWNARSAAIVNAIVIGDRAGLDEEVQRRLQEAGTYHVIAISGGNIAILAGLLLAGFRFAGWLGRAAMVSSIAVLLAYEMLVGSGASVDRATLMAVIYFAARAIDQRSPPLNALSLTAVALTVADPLIVVDPAFLLTFGATFAILVVVPVMTARQQTGQRAGKPDRLSTTISAIKQAAFAMFAASFATEALLFPIGALTFSRVTFAGLGLNFLAIPLMAVAQVAGMAAVPLAIVSTMGAAVVGWIAHVGAAGLVWSADLVRFVPVLAYRVAAPSWIAIAVYYSTLTVWWLTMRSAFSIDRRLSQRAGCTCGCIAATAALWILVDPRTFAAARGDGRLHLTFLDVGQGDSAFVVFPYGSTMVVDTGGLSASSSFDIGDRVVAPVIRTAGFHRIDWLALTHGDPDHIGGAASIVREFKPREVWEGIPVPRFEPLTALRLAVQGSGARWANVYRGDHVTVDEVEIVARHPVPADWERQRVRNDDSLVLDLRWREVSILLTGDIGKAVEGEVAAATPPARLRIVKVPHHGSLTSSTPAFLRALNPSIAIVSAGRSNHFGHPVPEILERYRSVGAEIFRTDRDGAVMVDTDGQSIDVRTFTGRRFSVH